MVRFSHSSWFGVFRVFEAAALGFCPVQWGAASEYELLSTVRTGTMQKEMVERAREGYKYLATSNGYFGVATLLERNSSADDTKGTHEYRLLATAPEKTSQNAITEFRAAGYEIVDLRTIDEFIIILDRTNPQRAPAIERPSPVDR